MDDVAQAYRIGSPVVNKHYYCTFKGYILHWMIWRTVLTKQVLMWVFIKRFLHGSAIGQILRTLTPKIKYNKQNSSSFAGFLVDYVIDCFD